jgi:hypothetical protein
MAGSKAIHFNDPNWLSTMRDAGWCGAERVLVWSFYGQGMRTAGSSDGFFAEALAKFGDQDPTQGSPWDKGERLAKLVRQNRTLLVLDGVEPMQYRLGEQEGRFKNPALQTLVQELAVDNKGLLLTTSRLGLRDLDDRPADMRRTSVRITNTCGKLGHRSKVSVKTTLPEVQAQAKRKNAGVGIVAGGGRRGQDAVGLFTWRNP